MYSPPGLVLPLLQVFGLFSQSAKPALDVGVSLLLSLPPPQAVNVSSEAAATAMRPVSPFDLVRMSPPVRNDSPGHDGVRGRGHDRGPTGLRCGA